MKKNIVMFSILFAAINILGQKIPDNYFTEMKARSIGPAGMSGRVTAIDVSPDNPDEIYAGSASGGLWFSRNGGINWKPLFDEQPFLSIGAVKIDPKRKGIIWVGTGEGNPRNSQSSGNGIYKSSDGGRTWKNLGLEKTRNIHRILINPINPDIVYAGAQGSAWNDSEERGVFKTTDGGKSWRKILFVNKRTGIADLVMDPENPEKLIAAMWEFHRDPWFFNSGGKGSGLYISFDGGETWKKRTDKDGLPCGELGRIGIAIAPSNPDVIYSFVESKKNAIYKSSDGGFKWKKVSEKNIGNRPFYYAEIYADPKNENRIYSIYSTVNVSEDGGKTFSSFLGWKVHPDHHAWFIHPKNPSFIIDGNDGGMAITRDRGKTWRFIQNLPLAQFYHINFDMDYPYHVYGGMQDNGSWKGPSRVFRNGGIQNTEWEEVGFGDGFDVVPYPKNSRYGYAMSQGGSVYRYDSETGGSSSIQPMHPEGKKLRFNWNAAIAQDPFNSETIYFGSQFVHKSTDMGNTWEIISPDLTTNDTSKQKQDISGGLTYDVTDAENYTTVISIEPSVLNPDLIWAGSDDGNIQITKDGGENWENVAGNLPDAPENGWVPQIRASVYNESEAFAVVNNYRQGDWGLYVYHTKDFGKSWENILKGAKGISGYALSFIQDPIEPNLYFLGTESGLYFSLNAGKDWRRWTFGYPHVSTMDLRIHPREHDLVIGTFGRAAYIIDDIRPLRFLASSANAFQTPLKLFPVKDAYQMEYKRPAGSRFGADAEFKGENLPYGAIISYFLNPDSLNKKDSVKIEIKNSEGGIVRTLLKSPRKGINRLNWRLDEKGIRFPGKAKPKKKSGESGGGFLAPGTYSIVAGYAGYRDSVNVKVKPDFRKNISIDDILKRKEMADNLSEEIEKITSAADEMRNMKNTIKLLSERIKEIPETSSAALNKYVDGAKDSLNSVWEIVFGKENHKQGITAGNKNTVQSKLRAAYWVVAGRSGAPGQKEALVIKQAEKSVEKFLPLFEEFKEKYWRRFKKTIEESKLSFFIN